MLNTQGTNISDLLLLLVIVVFSVGILFVSRRLLKVSFPYFFMGMLGLVLGLAVGSLVAGPLAGLPSPYGKWLPIVVDVFVTVAFLDLFIAQAPSAARFFHRLFARIGFDQGENSTSASEIVLDTSVLIDGRIEEIARSGFILGKMLIPQFVLNELQSVADSDDSLKRAKGRKGLEVLDHIQHDQDIATEIVDEFTNHRDAVDSKLIKVAKARKAKILTVDFNLNKIAKIQGVHVLNINELAEAIKPVLIPGENLIVKVIQEGKEAGQGVGYLADGTMIVVEGGSRYIGREVDCEVVRIFQTMAGKMIFVQPKKKVLRTRK
jgi:uncharacterized protein YacL